MDVSEYYEQNGLVSFEQKFLTPDDDGGGLNMTNWGGRTYEHTYSFIEKDCVHFPTKLKDGRNGPAIEWERNKKSRRKARQRARVLESERARPRG